MTKNSNVWVGILVLIGGAIPALSLVTSCTGSCDDKDSCYPYEPAGGTSGTSGMDTGGASSGSGGKTSSTGGNTSGGSDSSGGGGQGGSVGGAAGTVAAAGEGGAAGSSVRQPCDGACTAPKPVCDEPRDTCVECLQGSDCTGAKTKCDTSAKTCVECLAPADCKSATAAKCDTGACVKCTSNDDCAQIAGKGVCDTKVGECVQCTAGNENACGGKSCNPATSTCTSTAVGSVPTCKPCVADSECTGGNQADPDARCIPMNFNGAPRANGFCLRRKAKTCGRPYTIPISAKSLSGASLESYCGIDQQNVTCEAVLDLIGDVQGTLPCADGEDTSCGCARDKNRNCIQAGEGGLCREVGTIANQCTYQCGTASDCPAGKACLGAPTSYCQ